MFYELTNIHCEFRTVETQTLNFDKFFHRGFQVTISLFSGLSLDGMAGVVVVVVRCSVFVPSFVTKFEHLKSNFSNIQLCFVIRNGDKSSLFYSIFLDGFGKYSQSITYNCYLFLTRNLTFTVNVIFSLVFDLK